MRSLRLVLVGAALVFAPTSAAAGRAVDSGIVLRVRPPAIAIRELDGTRRKFAVNRATIVTLNGRRVRLLRLHRGDVATVAHMGRFVTAVRAIRP
jgi:hypothetical protein